MRIIFAGTPEIAATILQGLLSSEHEIVAILTQPDRPSGRGQKLIPSPVKILALDAGIPVHQPVKLRDSETHELLRSYQADLMVVVAYGLIVPQVVLDIPRLGCWNVHVSLLPRWRGAAPIQRAIEAGDTETGVTLMQMDAGLDTGPILLQEKVAMAPDMTGGILHDILADQGSSLLLQGLILEEQGKLTRIAQPEEGVTYAHKLSKEEAAIDWSLKPWQIDCKVRAFNPWPVCYTSYNDQVIRIWRARLPEVQVKEQSKHIGQIVYIKKDALGIQADGGIVEVLEVQLPAGKILSIETFLNGRRDYFTEGAILL